MAVRVRRPGIPAAAVSAGSLLPGVGAFAADPQPAPSAQAGAVELPALRPGLWEFRRTVAHEPPAKPQVATLRKCTDPGADIREKMLELKKKNCRFTPLTKRKDHYLSSWTCPTAYGPARFRQVLILKDPGSYEDMIEMRSGQQMSQQRIEATRLGECPDRAAGVPPPATR
jgi:hypothetical protein